jgi:uncharacterized membrane protein YedE/YeeE
MNGVAIALAGGVLIGLSAVLLMLTLGRIAGVAGIIGGLFSAGSGDAGWRLAFVGGLIAGPFAATLFGAPLPQIGIDASVPVVLVAGLLVGFGARLGNGCTSGHGICGLARLSPRSLAATLTFMTVGATAVFVARHVLGG